MKRPGFTFAFFFFTLLLCTGFAGTTNAQTPIPPQQVREADAAFSKRVWRIIDLREKPNKPATWPGNPINKLLYNAAMAGQLKPYTSDSLTRAYNIEELVRLFSDTEIIQRVIDPDDPEIMVQDTIISMFDPERSIRWLLVLEESYFNRKYSTQFQRIIAIAPLYKRKALGIELGMQPLCWFRYYDRFGKEGDCRGLFVKNKIFNPRNQASQITFDDWFEQRLFHSYIVKTSNMYDYSISSMPEFRLNKLDALLEAEKEKQQLGEEEHDQWDE